MKLEKFALAAVLLCWPGMAAAQQSSETTESQSATAQSSTQGQQDPVAAAARRARERKEQKKDQSKTAKVWDNENIPTKPDSITVIGESGSGNATTDEGGNSETPAGTPAAASDAPPQDAEAAKADAKEKAAISSQISQAKEHLQSLNTDLDLLTRKNALDQQMYYNKPDYSSDKQGGTNLKDEQDQIDAKKQEIAQEQKKIEELTAKLSEKPADDSKPATNPQ